MNNEKEEIKQNNKSERCFPQTLIGIFYIVEFVSGLILLMFDVTVMEYDPFTFSMSLAMMLIPAVYFFVLTIKSARRK